MGALNCFHVKVALTLILEDSGVPRVGEGARMAVAHACQVVLVAAKCLGFSL